MALLHRHASFCRVAGLVAAAILLLHCQAPTELTLALSTDVPCDQLTGVTITVGSQADVEAKAPSTRSQTCNAAGNLGTIVVVPAGSKDQEVAIRVVAGVKRDPESCTAPGYGTGCIVARRSLQFIPHTPLTLDVPLRNACNGVICDITQTCVDGACTSAAVTNASACTTAGRCGEGALKPAAGPPLPPSPLVCGDTTGLQPAAAWPMFGYCPTHVGQSPRKGAQTNQVRWTVTAQNGIESGISVAADGTIYFGATDGTLYAVDPKGNLKWSKPVASLGFHEAAPAIARDGTLYVGSYDNNLYAVTPAGGVAWTFAVGGQVLTSANVAGDGSIYVGGGVGQSDAFALDGSGKVQWQFATHGNVISSPAVGFDGSVYFGSDDSYLYALGRDGSPRWSFFVNDDTHTPVVGSNGWVYFASKPSVCAVDGNGSLKWVTPTTGHASTPALGSDGTVYSGTDAGQLLAFDGATGAVKWSASLAGVDPSNQPMVGADGTIYVGATDGTFYAFTPSGAIKWQLTAGDAIHGPAAMGADGTVYFGSDDGKLYAVGP